MLINLYFGDYFDDGHGKYYHVLVKAPSEKNIEQAITKVKEEYPNFFKQLAYEYGNNQIGPEVEKALLNTDYPIEHFNTYMENTKYKYFNSLEEVFQSDIWEDDNHEIDTIELVSDMVIWMLNYYGAEIKIAEKINLPFFTFTSGYGLF